MSMMFVLGALLGVLLCVLSGWVLFTFGPVKREWGVRQRCIACHHVEEYVRNTFEQVCPACGATCPVEMVVCKKVGRGWQFKEKQ